MAMLITTLKTLLYYRRKQENRLDVEERIESSAVDICVAEAISKIGENFPEMKTLMQITGAHFVLETKVHHGEGASCCHHK